MRRLPALALALTFSALLLSGCVGPAGEASSGGVTRPIDPVDGEVALVSAREVVRYDALAQTVLVDVEASARARDALDALLGVYLAKGACPAQQGPTGAPPASPLAAESFAFPSADSELRVDAHLSGGPVLPGEEVQVVWVGDAKNTPFGAYRCVAYRALPLSENPADSTLAALSAVSFQPATAASAMSPTTKTGATSATPSAATSR